MKILWMTWKDRRHPQAGGAELINEEIAKRLSRDGHEVILLVAGFAGGTAEESLDGYKVIRLGNRFTVYWHAYRHYKKCLEGWPDLVIDEMNTIPFFCKYYVRERNLLLAYQLCREIWFYQMRFPMNIVGYLVEPFYLWLLRDRFVITESNSTKQDMLRYGFLADKVSIVPIGIREMPLEHLDDANKFEYPTLLSLGSIRPMKRTLDQVDAFELAKMVIPDLRLKIAGGVSDKYGKEVLRRIAASTHANDIEYLGHVTDASKMELMQRSHFIMVTSVKEGWGLIVTEANAQGTPAVVYDVDGLRDSVKDKETGLISKENTARGLAEAIVDGLRNPEEYDCLRRKAWKWSQSFHSEKTYQSFISAIER